MNKNQIETYILNGTKLTSLFENGFTHISLFNPETKKKKVIQIILAYKGHK